MKSQEQPILYHVRSTFQLHLHYRAEAIKIHHFSDSHDKQKGDGYANRLAISLLFRKFGNMDESIREVFQYFALSLGFPPAIKILHTFLDCSTVQVCYKLLYNHV